MSKKAFDKIAAGLNEAIEVARGEKKPHRLHVPPELDIKAIRKKTALSQEQFAYRFAFTVDQIKAWEQGKARPLGGVRAYLMLIDQDHILVEKMLEQARPKKAA